jgi:hypothetical protein
MSVSVYLSGTLHVSLPVNVHKFVQNDNEHANISFSLMHDLVQCACLCLCRRLTLLDRFDQVG